jgi:hypothetical protein
MWRTIGVCMYNLLYLDIDSAEGRVYSLDTGDVDGWYQAAYSVIVDLEKVCWG